MQQIPVRKILTWLHSLGFIINHQKSTTTLVCLGLITEAAHEYMEPTTEWCLQHLVQLIITLWASPWTFMYHELCLLAVLGYELAPVHGYRPAKQGPLLDMVVPQPEPPAAATQKLWPLLHSALAYSDTTPTSMVGLDTTWTVICYF
jgi:hypothetical protein